MGGEGLLLMILQHVLHVGYIILGSGKLWGGRVGRDYTQRGRFGDYLDMGELKANKQGGALREGLLITKHFVFLEI